ncbi:DUF2637 domain-containing protein [Lentzea chajnantorensis]
MKTAVADKTDARIREADAAADRQARTREARLEFERKQRALKDARLAEERARRQGERATKRAAKQQRKQQRSAARKARRAQVWAGFVRSLDGQLVTILCSLAASAAWHGQFYYLIGKDVPVLFAAAAATALEVFGLAMGMIARSAGQYRDRAIRVRLFMWAIVGFSAASNYAHNGAILAVLSIAGPTAWEIREWWQHRAKLHEAGLLQQRPVRPRFPLDQALLFPLWTLHAYRVAVRDRIENTTLALSVAKAELETKAAEKAARKAARRLGRQAKKWAPAVRSLVDLERKAATETAAATLAKAEEVLGSAALLFGPAVLRDVAEATETAGNGSVGTTGDRRPAAGDRGNGRRGTGATGQAANLGTSTGQATGNPAADVCSAAAVVTADEAGNSTTETTERPGKPRGRRKFFLFGSRIQATETQTTEQTTGGGPVGFAEPADRAATSTGDRLLATPATATDEDDRGPTVATTETTDAAETATETTDDQSGETTGARLSVAVSHTDDRDDRNSDQNDRAQATDATETTEGATTDTTDVNVDDLIDDALEIGALLGDRLARDPLLTALRALGHRVGGRRREAIHQAVQDGLRDTTTAADKHASGTRRPAVVKAVQAALGNKTTAKAA